MKILLIAIPSVHFIRWINQLEGEKFELFYYNHLKWNIKEEIISSCKIINSSNYKSMRLFKGEGVLKLKSSSCYQLFDNVMSKFIKTEFEKILIDLKPDIVHAFELNTSAHPIVSVLNRYKNIKFIYSSWGSDFFFFKNLKTHKHKIQAVLKRADYLFTDCMRDFQLAKELGYKGVFLGSFPGGGGYDLNWLFDKNLLLNKKNIILIKGYENQFGRAINVLKAVFKIKNVLKDYKIIVFSANEKTINFIEKEKIEGLNIRIIGKNNPMAHSTFLTLFKEAKIYIGNSISDGMPNTLLEALVNGVFPIQSNPGDATSEIIENGKNGLLINDVKDINEISGLITRIVQDIDLWESAFHLNLELAKLKLDKNLISNEVIKAYKSVKIGK